jgi:hypothetical protein
VRWVFDIALTHLSSEQALANTLGFIAGDASCLRYRNWQAKDDKGVRHPLSLALTVFLSSFVKRGDRNARTSVLQVVIEGQLIMVVQREPSELRPVSIEPNRASPASDNGEVRLDNLPILVSSMPLVNKL